ncbi:MAG: fucose isomerase, partial [Candidatus Lokiarchaeota archaeon]|nr:fucose isomerase [Candidatus Lokiarchaeota archaeon]MBD3341186.1 fucose isomerase [Candidatus Lokiarchaeota archaeon]
MKQTIRIGVVCIARKTFDFRAAKEIYEKIKNDLRILENVEWEFISDLVIEKEEAQKSAHDLASRRIDALVCISGTFALGHLVLELNKVIRKPILLWGLEELPYDGGKIRLNSVCGINLNASNLYKSGTKNYHIVIGNEIDTDWLDAIRVLKAFSTAHVGVIGSRAHGFFNLDIDELDLFKRVGILIDYYQLDDVFNQTIDNHEILERKSQLEKLFDLSDLNLP